MYKRQPAYLAQRVWTLRQSHQLVTGVGAQAKPSVGYRGGPSGKAISWLQGWAPSGLQGWARHEGAVDGRLLVKRLRRRQPGTRASEGRIPHPSGIPRAPEASHGCSGLPVSSFSPAPLGSPSPGYTVRAPARGQRSARSQVSAAASHSVARTRTHRPVLAKGGRQVHVAAHLGACTAVVPVLHSLGPPHSPARQRTVLFPVWTLQPRPVKT